MEKTITTIIPFFNIGKGLANMVDSILAGTLLPTELLLIDDGSEDESSSLAESYANTYEFIKYIRLPHGGVSAARNHGIKCATGAWISFLDADDYIESDMYEQMLAAIPDDSFAGCLCGYFTEKDNISTAYHMVGKKELSSTQLLEAMFTKDEVRGFLFTRLFNARLVKTAAFDENIAMCEDLLFQSILLSSNPDLKFAVVQKAFYHYVQSNLQSTGGLNFFNNEVFKYKPAFEQLKELIPHNYVADSYESILEYSMYLLIKEYKSGNSDATKQINLLKQELRQNTPSKVTKHRLLYSYVPLLYSKFIK